MRGFFSCCLRLGWVSCLTVLRNRCKTPTQKRRGISSNVRCPPNTLGNFSECFTITVVSQCRGDCCCLLNIRERHKHTHTHTLTYKVEERSEVRLKQLQGSCRGSKGLQQLMRCLIHSQPGVVSRQARIFRVCFSLLFLFPFHLCCCCARANKTVYLITKMQMDQ